MENVTDSTAVIPKIDDITSKLTDEQLLEFMKNVQEANAHNHAFKNVKSVHKQERRRKNKAARKTRQGQRK